mmetsp:Transcript_101624/g.322767  ORF Transcript_101624/g.322767 Transcript_101624/m.322767 type:complete len:243 (-) Transcript_101624:715-1443(-)
MDVDVVHEDLGAAHALQHDPERLLHGLLAAAPQVQHRIHRRDALRRPVEAFQPETLPRRVGHPVDDSLPHRCGLRLSLPSGGARFLPYLEVQQAELLDTVVQVPHHQQVPRLFLGIPVSAAAAQNAGVLEHEVQDHRHTLIPLRALQDGARLLVEEHLICSMAQILTNVVAPGAPTPLLLSQLQPKKRRRAARDAYPLDVAVEQRGVHSRERWLLAGLPLDQPCLQGNTACAPGILSRKLQQ